MENVLFDSKFHTEFENVSVLHMFFFSSSSLLFLQYVQWLRENGCNNQHTAFSVDVSAYRDLKQKYLLAFPVLAFLQEGIFLEFGETERKRKATGRQVNVYVLMMQVNSCSE